MTLHVCTRTDCNNACQLVNSCKHPCTHVHGHTDTQNMQQAHAQRMWMDRQECKQHHPMRAKMLRWYCRALHTGDALRVVLIPGCQGRQFVLAAQVRRFLLLLFLPLLLLLLAVSFFFNCCYSCSHLLCARNTPDLRAFLSIKLLATCYIVGSAGLRDPRGLKS